MEPVLLPVITSYSIHYTKLYEEELRYARAFFRRQPWVVIDVSGKAVEETANEVLVKLKLK